MKKSFFLVLLIVGLSCSGPKPEDEFHTQLQAMNSAMTQELAMLEQADDLAKTITAMKSFLDTMQNLEKKFLMLSEVHENFDPFSHHKTKELTQRFQQNLALYAEKTSQANLRYFDNAEFKEILKRIGEVFH